MLAEATPIRGGDGGSIGIGSRGRSDVTGL